jgi:Sphingosine kinase and enzymes related to eukaryotic diacylglycerol kinase
MKVAIVLNGISLNKSRFYNKILPALQQVCKPDVFESQSKNDAISVTTKLMSRRYDYILAAGGDGTLNQVLNGMLRDYEPPSKLPVLGIIPLGGGNDFARALGISGDPAWLPNALRGETHVPSMWAKSGIPSRTTDRLNAMNKAGGYLSTLLTLEWGLMF